jgi:hypothetical protein
VEEIKLSGGAGSVPLFNSTLETGTRAVVVLNAAYPRALDLARLTWFDHLVVHTADAGGPPSLHPSLPERSGELLVRRRLVEDSLTLMRRAHLVDALADDSGMSFRAGDAAPAFVNLMRSDYAQALKARASWLVAEFADLEEVDMATRIERQVDRWGLEFGTPGRQPGSAL